MQVGSLVRYRKEYPDGMKIDWVGIVTDREDPNPSVMGFYVQWNNGIRDWRHWADLEVICK